MRTGVNLWTVYGWEPREPLAVRVLERLKSAGAEGIELIVDEGWFGAEQLLAVRDELAPRLADLGLAVPSVASGLFWKYSPGSVSPETRGRALRVIRDECQVAQAYGASVILVIPGMQEARTDYDITYDTAIQTLRQAAFYAEDYGVTIGLENVATSFLQSPREFAGFLRDVGSAHVRAYLDIGNVLAARQEYPENWIRALGGQIALVHVKDYDNAGTSLNGFRLCGEGSLDWVQTLTVLHEVGYDGFLLIETPPDGENEAYPELGLRAAETGIRWLRQFIPLTSI